MDCSFDVVFTSMYVVYLQLLSEYPLYKVLLKILCVYDFIPFCLVIRARTLFFSKYALINTSLHNDYS